MPAAAGAREGDGVVGARTGGAWAGWGGPQPERSPQHPLRLTAAGRAQVERGERLCRNLDVPFMGADAARPVASFEVAALVRLARVASQRLADRTGAAVELRPLADRRLLLWLGVLWLLVWLVAASGDGALVAVLDATLTTLFAGTAALAVAEWRRRAAAAAAAAGEAGDASSTAAGRWPALDTLAHWLQQARDLVGL
jgi:hypothetical protein